MAATFDVDIIADSVSPDGVRLTTFQLLYPRIIHAEFMTHRVFSRNASSSRAIPVKRQIEMVETNPYVPMNWGQNQAGMQAGEALSDEAAREAEMFWMRSVRDAVSWAKALVEMDTPPHKQFVNRILEPYSHISVVCTATDFVNFFALRCHPDAQPEIQELARRMWAAYQDSRPTMLGYDQWHLPYVWPHKEADEALAWLKENQPKNTAPGNVMALLTQLSVARCARVSYLKHDGSDPSIADDMALYQRLVGSQPMHASPTEHQATPDRWLGGDKWAKPELHGNLFGWQQYRQMLPGQRIAMFEEGGRKVSYPQMSNQIRQLGM